MNIPSFRKQCPRQLHTPVAFKATPLTASNASSEVTLYLGNEGAMPMCINISKHISVDEQLLQHYLLQSVIKRELYNVIR